LSPVFGLPIGNEEEPNLTLFFRPFLNTREGMDVHVGTPRQVHYEKGSEKDPQAPS